ncbi:MAG: 4'-phosphopantetheinyl transferase superfamily protein, partial [Propionibacteriaceae bacterium]|nr:4'-phosphopantetheinyl transferase superfamily protein [Propionibacteriaceae bacterium]
TSRDATDQLRRVHAALFVEGGPADLDIIGVRREILTNKSVFLLPEGAPLLKDLDTLDKAVERYYRPANQTAETEPAKLGLPDLGELPNPVLRAMEDNLRQAVSAQSEVVQRFKERGLFDRPGRSGQSAQRPAVAKAPTPAAIPAAAPVPGSEPGDENLTRRQKIFKYGFTRTSDLPTGVSAEDAAKLAPKGPRRGTRFESPVVWKLEDMPYVIDHSIVRQPLNWPYLNEVAPVIPLTLSFEFIAEMVLAMAPGMNVSKISNVVAMGFISLQKPFHAVVKAFWKSERTVVMSIDGHFVMDMTVSSKLPKVPSLTMEQVEEAIGPDITDQMPDPDYTYSEYAFHRAAYQSAVRMTRLAKMGMAGITRKVEGRGSLFDNMGQSLGLFLHLTQVHNQVSFPIRVGEINLYEDLFYQYGDYESAMVVRSITRNYITGDMILAVDGEVWGTAHNWVNQRLPVDEKIWDVTIHPERYLMADTIAPGVYYFHSLNENRQAQVFVGMRYLNAEEQDRFEAMGSEAQKRAFLIGRLVLKDAVRAELRDPEKGYPYPVEIGTRYDERGKLFVGSRVGPAWPRELEVSISHKPDRAVAIVRQQPVGIDLEEIVERDEAFMALAFTPTERKRLASLGGTPDWVTRFWVAKEAYGKMLGVGLDGDPKRYEVEVLEGDTLAVAGTSIKTMVVSAKFIVGWTE